MKKSLTILSALFLLALPAFAQMTDEQVVAYVKSAYEAGRSQTQIVTDLARRGVTRAQAERLMSQYQEAQEEEEGTSSKTSKTGKSSKRGRTSGTQGSAAAETDPNTRTFTDMSETMTEAQVDSTATLEFDARPEIFGHSLFSASTGVSFEPNENVATPENYTLGPGDEVVIEVWGLSEANMREVISAEGRINISMVGPIYLNGLTIKQAEDKIKKALAGKYSGVDGENPASSLSVSLGNVRTINVNVLGEVFAPGTYRLSSFTTVFNSLHRAGGITETGSLRAIKVVRGGKEVATVDVYDYLFYGKTDTDVKLLEGDVVIVPTYQNLVYIEGGVKRPMYYEMKEDETVGKLIEYAGGFVGNSYKGDVSVVRFLNPEKQIFTVEADRFSDFVLEDGDEVTIKTNTERFSNAVSVEGYVYRPGKYELGDRIVSLRQLVSAAGGVTPDAFLDRAVLHREKENLDYESMGVNLGALLRGEVEDILLRNNDSLVVACRHDVVDRGTLTINGYVTNPGEFPYAENTTLQDLILMADGFADGASTARIDVARRVYNPVSTTRPDTLGFVFSVSLENGLAAGDDLDNFILEPYDVVSVRVSPGFRPQTFVTLEGQVNFPGDYALIKDGERISELIARAGGITNVAYLAGARVIRSYADNELLKTINKSIEKVSESSQRDSLEVEVEEFYTVSIDLAAAMSKPGSDADIVLQKDDRIIVPEYVNTVQVMGEVMFPNAVSYVPGKPLSYYINSAGGFTQAAKKSKVYVIHMNGSASRSGMGRADIQPGSIVIVPSKPERAPVTASEIASTATMATSLTSMVAMLVNLLR